ncbi:hypothetical protein DAPPUDRAFT_253428 [Daphnia pulex]|uniref:Uncharacterized protein n=1 Tax=Daphnia pulex TaxID=6669 RepID=E9H4T4_DAPPU|nr:hypothetical protein DAPPUDRAFT_253431 [Daphnia pulex]EFX73300.1 hypothetical protein DAPPUDRAFT_253428 [Daphnia pulex]|eukprot:EFX73297.1 hypothetical protein DAPPUDRAFT_253431 [Daphnia pulex]
MEKVFSEDEESIDDDYYDYNSFVSFYFYEEPPVDNLLQPLCLRMKLMTILRTQISDNLIATLPLQHFNAKLLMGNPLLVSVPPSLNEVD